MSVGRRRTPSSRSVTRKATDYKMKNERERQRIRQVNEAFDELRHRVPVYKATSKRVSKLRILEGAIEYIRALSKHLETIKESKPPKKTKGHK
ncbi:hypothetical protein QR680_017026 [Steinernema hermaphroditum]|uniref:BHLH domain-containing protein n=1 Tax=Steinernema hermaphroditum TaxID=289476 RepID=A0AA39LN96_9BILA|nr:hypothetical protein QR680_017026 [Steinernema hermaphroditum]